MNELTIDLKSNSGKPMYEQIYDYIRQEIISGRFAYHTKLPSTRTLAGHLDVSRNTVALAYAQLISEGYIETVRGSGHYVCRLDGLYRQSSGASVKGNQSADKTVEYAYDFSPNGVDLSRFPYAVWRRLTREVLADEAAGLFRLGPKQGEYGLRESICRYLYEARGVSTSPDQIIVGAGSDYLLMMIIFLLRSVIGSNVCVAMETPTYINAYRTISLTGTDVVTTETDKDGMLPSDLEKKTAQVAYIMPSHQYPIGTVMPITRRLELLSWAGKEANRFLIEDDYDSEFRYRGKPVPAMTGSDTQGRVIYLSTFSRTIAPAIRVSYMVLPNTLADAFKTGIGRISSTVTRVDQHILKEFMDRGLYGRHLNRMRALYKSKHDKLLNDLRPWKNRLRVSGDGAGVHILLHLGNYLSEEEAIRLAAESGIRVYGLSGCCVEGQHVGEGTVIIMGYAVIPYDKIDEAVERLAEAWHL